MSGLNVSDFPAAVREKYEINGVRLGSGSFGQVTSGKCRQTGQRVAFKLIRNAFHSPHDARRVLREISIMRQCNHPNIVALKGVFAPGVGMSGSFRDICLVMPNCGHDLARVIAAAHNLEAWATAHVKFFMWQLLCALKYLHSANIAHRDLKPSNILVTDDSHLTLIDFGLARQLLSGRKEPSLVPVDAGRATLPASPPRMARTLTKHVVTRWYRAPEIVLQNERYSDAIDLWSAGCIYAELLETLEPQSTKPAPLFPGRTSLQSDPHRFHKRPDEIINDPNSQINRIFQVIGSPSSGECNRCVSDEVLRHELVTMPRFPRVSFCKIYPNASPDDIFILDHTLQFDPQKRRSAEQLLAMTYWDDVRDASEEKGASAHIDFQFEDEPIANVRDDPRGELGRQAIRREVDLCFFPGDRVHILNGAYNHHHHHHHHHDASQHLTALTEGTVVSCEGSRATVRLDWEMADGQAAMAYVGLDALSRHDPSSAPGAGLEAAAHGSGVGRTDAVQQPAGSGVGGGDGNTDTNVATACWPVMYIHPSEGLGKPSSEATGGAGAGTPGVTS